MGVVVELEFGRCSPLTPLHVGIADAAEHVIAQLRHEAVRNRRVKVLSEILLASWILQALEIGISGEESTIAVCAILSTSVE